jgi:hypothetical protein
MAFVLIALSIGVQAMPSVDYQDLNTSQHQENISASKAVSFYFEEVAQVSFSIDEQETLPLPTLGSYFYKAGFDHKNNFSQKAFLNKLLHTDYAFISKAYIKEILFPFHSHW